MKNHVFGRSDRVWLFLLYFIYGSLLPLAAQTEEGVFQPRKWNMSFTAEHLWPGTGKTNLTPTTDICTLMLAQTGNTSCAVSVKPGGAVGVQVSFFRDSKKIEFGPSIGYFSGGPGMGHTSIQTSGSFGAPANVELVTSANTMRFLGKARKNWFRTESMSIRLGMGLGMAVSNQITACSRGGSNNVNCGNFNLTNYSSLGWVTWELSSALLYKDISLGLRYVGFGRGGKSPWNTLGAFFGIDF